MEEEFATLSVRPGLRYTIRAGFKKDGTLHALGIDAISNAGSYRGSGAIIGCPRLELGTGCLSGPESGRKSAVGLYSIAGIRLHAGAW